MTIVSIGDFRYSVIAACETHAGNALQTPDDGRKIASRDPHGQPLAKLDFLLEIA